MKLTVAEKKLIALDPDLGAVIKANGTVAPPPRRRDHYAALAEAIISQQISVKAAACIFERFENITKMRPELVLHLSEGEIKTIGLSGQKTRYLQDLARHFTEDAAVFDHLENLDDDAVVAELTRVKGIGVWTAQMFLIFTLQRPDIFAAGDRGLQAAVERIYGLPTKAPQSRIAAIADRWRPYRTTASLHLWRSLDNMPAATNAGVARKVEAPSLS